MGYDNPLHGLDGNGDWATAIGRSEGVPKPLVSEPEVELDREQALRLHALHGVTLLGLRPSNLTMEEVIDAASWVLTGDQEEDEEVTGYLGCDPSTAEAFRQPEEAFRAKVQERIERIRPQVEALFSKMREDASDYVRPPDDVVNLFHDEAKNRDIGYRQISPEALSRNDIVAPCGDWVVGPVKWDGALERWILTLHCPKTADGETFEKWARPGEKITVYDRPF